MSRLCRTCLNNATETTSLFNTYGPQKKHNLTLTDMLQAFITFKLIPDDGLPSDICIPCADDTVRSYFFKIKCEKSNEILQSNNYLVKNEDLEELKNEDVEEFKNEDLQSLAKSSECNYAIASIDKIDTDFSECDENASKVTYKKKKSMGKRIRKKSSCKELDNNVSLINIDIDNNYNKDDASQIGIYKCKYCEFSSNTKTEYIQHRKNTHRKSLTKNKVDKNSKYKINPFIETVKDGIKQYNCTSCDYKSHAKSNLLMHLKNHFGEKPFHCDHCKFKTNFRASLQAHLRIHTGEKPFLCDICDFRFKQVAHLKQHKLTHSHERPWACQLCGYRAKAKRHLDNHLRTHTGEKPFMCDLCSFTCANHVNLLSHKRSHSDTKMFKCDLCSYASNFKKNLLMHVVKHTGIKAFLCQLCEYRGTCAQNLKAHMISHSQEKPFTCNICAYRTKTNSMLNKHLKTHSR